MSSPLAVMKIRRDSPNNSFGKVRNGGKKFHGGWDLSAKVGTPVLAIADGEIAAIGNSRANAEDKVNFGRYVSLKFTFKEQTLYAFYAHLSEISVKEKQIVKDGQVLGKSGKTGNAYNMSSLDEHLHFEILTVPLPRRGDTNKKMDPGRILGFEFLACKAVAAD